MKKCQNPDCGKMFEPDKHRPDQKYCCKKCNQHALYISRYKQNYKPKTERVQKQEYDRPLTRLTVYLVHKWHAEGLPLTEIANITNRSIKRILQAYKIPLTEKEKAKLETYKKGV